MATVTPPPWTYALHLPHDPRAPGIARAALRVILDAHGLADLRDDAELLASELLTNAHLHTTGAYGLRLAPRSPGGVRVSVWDSSPEIPPGFHAGGISADAAESGRGLHLVRACADAWGAYSLGTTRRGKLLWAECRNEPTGSTPLVSTHPHLN
ncbi:ATP-binding protein [Streptomyces sp. NPDC055144]